MVLLLLSSIDLRFLDLLCVLLIHITELPTVLRLMSLDIRRKVPFGVVFHVSFPIR